LVAQTFARAGRHNYERIVARNYILDDSFLRSPKLPEAKYFFKLGFELRLYAGRFCDGRQRHRMKLRQKKKGSSLNEVRHKTPFFHKNGPLHITFRKSSELLSH
jgi:hypothetical protein